METQISKRKSFYRYIKKHFKPSLVYYPGSGFDKVPKSVFGKYHVIHLTLLEHQSNANHLERLGDGIEILGDINNSPIADNSVDMILIHGAANKKMLEDFDRVLKPKGIVTIDNSGWTYHVRSRWNELYKLFKNYKPLDLPKGFEAGQNVFGVCKDGEDNGWYVNSEQEMMDYVTSHKGYTGFKEILDYAVFQKPE
jgi:hypothetical protein